MKKKNFIIAILVFIIGAGIFVWINQPAATFDDITIPQDDEIVTLHENEQEVKKQDEQQEENVTNEPRQLSTKVIEAFQSTINFFSNRDTNIVGVGDSLTQGVGSSYEEGGYIGILDRTINAENQIVSFDNFGIRGDRSDQLLDRLDNPEMSTAIEDADIVLITIGANDIMKVVKENFSDLNMDDFTQERMKYEERLNQIVTKIKNINPDTAIYLLGFYNPFEKYFQEIEELGMIVEDWNRTGRMIAADDEAITFIPTVDLFDDPNADLFAEDNFHPNDLGYQRMAKRVLDYLTNGEG